MNRIIDSTASESLSPWCALPARAECLIIILIIIIRLRLCLANHAIDGSDVARACEPAANRRSKTIIILHLI